MPIDRRLLLKQGAAALAAGLCAPARARGPAGYPAPDREMMVPVAGGRIYVRVNGRLDGPLPPIVAIHGGPGSTHTGFLNLLALAETRAVVLYDHLDSGLSDHPGLAANWQVGRFVDEVDQVRRALGIARWHVLGHSWGGTIALEYGARRPQGLASLILASPLVSTRSWLADAAVLRGKLPADVRKILDACDPPAPITPACDAATDRFYAEFLSREPAADGLKAYRAAHPGLAMNDKIYNAMWGSSEFVSTGTLRDYDGEPLLARLDGARTLFVCGQYDEARPATMAGFAERVPGARFAVIPGAGHGFFGDSPEETLGILRPWLAQHDGATG